jgi:hypothetical protein
MSIVLPGGARATATLVGPSDVIEGQYPPPPQTPATFVLTLSDVSGAVPLDPADFLIIDELGNPYHPQVTVTSSPPGAPLPPSSPLPPATPPGAPGSAGTQAPAGSTTSARIHDVLPTGSGQVRWSPGGRTAIATWDFSLEID